MKYLLIQNKGEIDVNALILMGGSTKRDDNQAIGFFGSGNKYAIALLLKNKIDFKIYSGTKELKIETRNVKFRDKEFDQILINGQETSLTTDMGPQWEPWMAVREFVSNSIDEGNHHIVNSVDYTEGIEGNTRVYISHSDKIKEVIDNWDSYFSFDRVDAVLNKEDGKVFPHLDDTENMIYFRKGIRCHNSYYVKTLYQYDFPKFPINESRVLTTTWEASKYIYSFLSENVTLDIAHRFLKLAYLEQYEEQDWMWNNGYVSRMSPVWKEAIGNNILIVSQIAGWFMDEAKQHPHYYVTLNFAKCLKKHFPELTIYGLMEDGEKSSFKRCEVTPKMDFILKKGVEFLQEAKYNINYPIEIGNFSAVDQLGGIKNNTILLSSKVFDMGVKEVVMTIVEENEHLNTKYQDKSREFQNHFIRLFVTEMENKIGNIL